MKTIVAGALGECVHVAGVLNFLRLAEMAGWRTVFLGPAVPISDFIQVIKKENADLVGISYRLTPETGERLLGEFAESADELRQSGVRFLFGGTPPVAERAKAMSGFFSAVYDGKQSPEEILAFLRGKSIIPGDSTSYPQDLISRLHWKAPYPLLRHHFGLPTMEASIEGIKQIAQAKVLDVISLGIDQDAQENFFHPERQNPRQKGAGGVPVRSGEDYRQLFQASRSGNFPLMRTYSGTDDFLELAELVTETIHNAWCAIPLFWFNQLDGRGPWSLEESIQKHQEVMAWYGERNIPVELNEPHHWGMRDASDVIFVVSAYLSAYNARAFGVKDYIAQMMFNSPPGTTDAMDLAKMLAVMTIIKPLANGSFRIWKQTRTGLLSYPIEQNAARAHLASSIYLQMAMKPDIIHIVGHTEADHAATGTDVVDAALMARKAIENAVSGQPDPTHDPQVQTRIKWLLEQAQITLKAISDLAEGSNEPFTDPQVLGKALRKGILDAPHLKNSKIAKGQIKTQIINGACETVDNKGNFIDESQRLKQLV